MLYENLNILAVNTDENLTRLLNGILGAIGYKLSVEKGNTFPYKVLSEHPFNLLIVDNTASPFLPDDLKKVQLIHPEIHTILISNNLSDLDPWIDFKNLNIIEHKALPERLPFVISHFYSEFSNRQVSNLAYWNLIKTALYDNHLFTAIVDKNSDILFLNRTAQEILKVNSDDESNLNFSEFLKEGKKVWNYVINKFHSLRDSALNMQLELVDSNYKEFTFPVSVRAVKNGHDYFIIHGACLANINTSPTFSSETVLNAFADSLANELLNPLNVIWGRLQLFQTSSHLSEQDKRHLEMIERQIHRINEVVARLVSFTSIKRDLVPQKVFLNEILKRLLFQPSWKQHQERLKTDFAKNLPAIYGQVAHIELLFNMIIDLILNLTPAKSQIILATRSQKTAKDGREQIVAQITIEHYTEALDQYLLKNSLQFKETGKMKFALELTIIRFILDEYQIRHELIEDKSSLILTLSFTST